MNIAPARRAALSFLSGDGWREEDWDARQERWHRRPELADPRDRRLFSRLTAGVVRLQGRLDARLMRLAGRGDLDPELRNALRLALLQLEDSDRLPAHAVVSDSVEWVKRRRGARLAGLANALLRRYLREGIPGADPDPARDALGYARDVLSYPDWLARRWLAELGQEAAFALMRAMNDPAPLCLRWNARRPGREAFLAALEAQGAEAEALPGLPQAFRLRGAWPAGLREALERGDLSVQDETAQRTALLMVPAGGARDGRRWADLCAAPGGKCCLLAEIAGQGTRIFAMDKSPARLEKVVANRRRLGLEPLSIEASDLLQRAAEPQDAVLLDAPCSDLAVLGANPDARWRKSEAGIEQLAGLQARLLDAAAAWVAPGGLLVYSVCTLTPEETSAQRSAFLAAHPGMRLDPIGDREQPASCLTAAGELMVWPDSSRGAGGYAVRFRREDA
jgi:16S rRNA (cytosine967-C5)-methyltransferase